MIERVKVAVVGVGNNVSALVQGIAATRTSTSRSRSVMFRRRAGGFT
ncbi:hypothetical protein ACWDTT_17080 [Streptosporangium sandarakinum]